MSTTKSSMTSGALWAVLATMIWSGNFIIARGLSDAVSPATLAFMRWTIASVAVLPFAWKAMRADWPVIRANFGYILITSFLGVTIFNTMIYQAGHATNALNLSLISTSFPVFIVIISRIFLGEAVTMKRILGIVMAVSGIVALVIRGDIDRLLGLTFNSGDLWMLAAAIVFAVYSILIRRKPEAISPFAFLGITFLSGLVMLLPWTIWEQLHTPWPAMTMPLVGSALYIGIGASLAAYFSWNRAVATIGPAKAGFIYYSLPVFSGVEAWLILGEPITMLHVLCGACIVSGIYISTKS